MSNNKKFIGFRYLQIDQKNPTTNGVHLWRVCKNKIENPNELIIHSNFRVVIDYPLRFPKLFIFEPFELSDYNSEKADDFDLLSAITPINGFSRFEILNILSQTYKNIYKEEKSTMTAIINNHCEHNKVNMRANNVETNGVHSIYDQELTRLSLNGMIYNNQFDYWKLFVSSV